MSRKITMEYDPAKSTVQIETTGFQGSSCTEATAQLEAAFGAVKEDFKKPEYYDKGAEAKLHQR